MLKWTCVVKLHPPVPWVSMKLSAMISEHSKLGCSPWNSHELPLLNVQLTHLSWCLIFLPLQDVMLWMADNASSLFLAREAYIKAEEKNEAMAE